jgi:hypothetical protein
MLNQPQRGIRADCLWITRANNRLAPSHQAPGWRLDDLGNGFYFRALGPDLLFSITVSWLLP